MRTAREVKKIQDFKTFKKSLSKSFFFFNAKKRVSELRFLLRFGSLAFASWNQWSLAARGLGRPGLVTKRKTSGATGRNNGAKRENLENRAKEVQRSFNLRRVEGFVQKK